MEAVDAVARPDAAVEEGEDVGGDVGEGRCDGGRGRELVGEACGVGKVLARGRADEGGVAGELDKAPGADEDGAELEQVTFFAIRGCLRRCHLQRKEATEVQ